MKKLLSIVTLTVLAGVAPLFAQSSHPSENFPGKGGNQDQTNGAPNSPEQQNPSTGQQATSPTPPKSQ